MNKKLVLSVAAAAMIGTLAVGGTLAWFTDTETATNVVTTGKVDIKLDEYGEGNGANVDGGLWYYDVMPGDEFTKKVTITNVGNDAYVRAKIIVSGSDTIMDTFSNENPKDNIIFTGLENVTWTPDGEDEDGNTAYAATVEYSENEGIMKKSDPEISWEVFSQIVIPGEAWDNSFVDEQFNIKVVAEAIQSKNFDTAADAWGNTIYDIPEAESKEDAHGENTVPTEPESSAAN